MRRATLLFAIIVASLVLTAEASASVSNFRAVLHVGEEVPEPTNVETNPRGVATFQLRGDELSYRLIVANIENVTQAHIHCGAVGVAGPVVAFLYPPTAPPVLIPGRFNGVLATGTITEANVIPRDPSDECPDGVADFEELLERIRSGDAYVNVHTSQNPPGEIRGQIR